jgi:predicted phage terminase large subunit-like protein
MAASVLWPERESLYDLMLLRATIGAAAFNSEKQNDPIDPSACEWPGEYFEREDFWFSEWPARLQIKVAALDPSKGRDAKHGDYSAVVLYGRDPQGVEYVECNMARRTVDVICGDTVRLAKAFGPEVVVVETNTFQELLLAPLAAAARTEQYEMRTVAIENNVPKAVRIRRLTEPLCQRKARFKARSPGTALLVQQLRDFPHGDHDDGPDSYEMARRVAIELHNSRQRKRPGRARA